MTPSPEELAMIKEKNLELENAELHEELNKLIAHARKVKGSRDVHSVYEVLDQLKRERDEAQAENAELRDRVRAAEETAKRAEWDMDTLRADMFRAQSDAEKENAELRRQLDATEATLRLHLGDKPLPQSVPETANDFYEEFGAACFGQCNMTALRKEARYGCIKRLGHKGDHQYGFQSVPDWSSAKCPQCGHAAHSGEPCPECHPISVACVPEPNTQGASEQARFTDRERHAFRIGMFTTKHYATDAETDAILQSAGLKSEPGPCAALPALKLAEKFIAEELETREQSYLPEPNSSEEDYLTDARSALEAVQSAIAKAEGH